MDQKRTQRIVGIVIVIALVIILFPLLFSKTDSTTTTVATVKAPPFPDQPTTNTDIAMQVTNEAPANDTQPVVTPVASEEANVAEKPLIEKTAEAEQAVTTAPAIDTVNQKPNESIKIADTPQLLNDEPPLPVVPVDNKTKSQDEVPLPAKSSKENRTHVKSVLAKSKPAHLIQKDLMKLNTTAWVVQMGSFRDKNNAHRLADRLRSAGYKAFTREVTAKNGSQVRVYVGPEFKHLAATKLSSQIEHDLNMHGIIVTYNPLSL